MELIEIVFVSNDTKVEAMINKGLLNEDNILSTEMHLNGSCTYVAVVKKENVEHIERYA